MESVGIFHVARGFKVLVERMSGSDVEEIVDRSFNYLQGKRNGPASSQKST